jgi:uncharacterized membrane protein
MKQDVGSARQALNGLRMAAKIVGLLLVTTAVLDVLSEGFRAEALAAASLGALFLFIHERPFERGAGLALSKVGRLLARLLQAFLGALVALEGVGALVVVALPDPFPPSPLNATFIAGSGLVAITAGVALLLHAIRGRRRGRTTQLLVIAASAMNLIVAGFAAYDIVRDPFSGTGPTGARSALVAFAIFSAVLALEGLANQRRAAPPPQTVTA